MNSIPTPRNSIPPSVNLIGGFFFFIYYACIVSLQLQELPPPGIPARANLCTFALLIYIGGESVKEMLKCVKIFDRCNIVHTLAPDNNKKNYFIMTTQKNIQSKINDIEAKIYDIKNVRNTMRLDHSERVYNLLSNAWANLCREAWSDLGYIKVDIDEKTFNDLKAKITEATNTPIKY